MQFKLYKKSAFKILINIYWLIVEKFSRIFFGLLGTLFIARYLGAEKFGIISFSIAYVDLFSVIATLGLPTITVRELVKNPNDANVILGTVGLSKFASGILIYFLSILVIYFFRKGDDLAINTVMILGTISIFKFSDISVYWFDSVVKSKYTSYSIFLALLTTTIIKFILIIYRGEYYSFIYVTTAEKILIGAFLLFSLNRWGKKLADLKFKLSLIIDLLKDSWPLLISSLSIIIYMRVDQIMLGKMIGDYDVGIYSIGVKFTEIFSLLPFAIINSVFPSIIRAKEYNNKVYLKRIQNLYNFITFISFIYALFIFINSEFIINLLFGSNYSGSITVSRIYCWSCIFISMGVARAKWIVSENYQYLTFWFILVGTIINVIGNYYFIPYFGAKAAAFTSLITQVITVLVTPFLFKKLRISVKMLIQSLNPINWFLSLREMKKLFFNEGDKYFD